MVDTKTYSLGGHSLAGWRARLTVEKPGPTKSNTGVWRVRKGNIIYRAEANTISI